MSKKQIEFFDALTKKVYTKEDRKSRHWAKITGCCASQMTKKVYFYCPAKDRVYTIPLKPCYLMAATIISCNRSQSRKKG